VVGGKLVNSKSMEGKLVILAKMGLLFGRTMSLKSSSGAAVRDLHLLCMRNITRRSLSFDGHV
jgi:hypothetical protein